MLKKHETPNFENCTREELLVALKVTTRKQDYKRLFAIQQLSFKLPFEAVAESNLMTYKTLNNWIKRFNKQGIDGLIEKSR
ncbi:MAG: helix-turn-helix domain-containing protein, partial [Nitrospirae bacterium]|nr:helix-turn-helix domain-containing protein [Nitrospirota bacterium]